MDLNPAQFKLLLAGPKVSRLMPFVTQRGYYADGCATGSETLEVLRQSPVHVLLVELDLDDMLLADLVQIVRSESLAGAVILLDDPAKSGLIVSQLLRGVDGYVATPPDEQYLFRIIERQLLAQWAIAQLAQSEQDAADKQRLEKAVQNERGKVTELVKEIASLRDQLANAKMSRGSPMDVPDTQLGMAKKRPAARDDDDDDGDEDDEAVTLRAARAVASQVRSEAGSETNGSGQDDRTSPAGFTPPPGLRDAVAKKKAIGPARDTGFDEVAHTQPSMNKIIPGFGDNDDELNEDDLADDDDDDAATKADDDGDLFLELEDPTEQQATQQPRNPIVAPAKKPVSR